jgi:prepilin-type processing-associated H-X9-DG protein
MRMNYSVNTRATSRYHVNSLNKLAAVAQPSRFMLFTEGVVNPTLGSGMQGPYNYFTAISWAQKSLQQYPHAKRQNVVFLDGHVEMLEPDDFPDGSAAYKQPLWSGNNL